MITFKLITALIIGVLLNSFVFAQNRSVNIDRHNNVKIIQQNDDQHTYELTQKGKDQLIYLFQSSHPDSISHRFVSNQTGFLNLAYVSQNGLKTTFNSKIIQQGEKNTAVIRQDSSKSETKDIDTPWSDTSFVRITQTGSGNKVIVNQN